MSHLETTVRAAAVFVIAWVSVAFVFFYRRGAASQTAHEQDPQSTNPPVED